MKKENMKILDRHFEFLRIPLSEVRENDIVLNGSNELFYFVKSLKTTILHGHPRGFTAIFLPDGDFRSFDDSNFHQKRFVLRARRI